MATSTAPRRQQAESRSNLKLSELARHLCIPKGVKTSSWHIIEARCNEFGVHFDRWQQGIGTLAFAHRKDGYYACGIGGAWLSIPRQTGKTYLFGWAVFALASLYENLTIIWTAHHLRTSDQTFNKMAAMAEKRQVRPFIKHVRRSNGQQEIEFTTGSRIMFGSRAYGFGRGFDEVDVMVFDECQILNETALSDMLPATNAAPNGLPLFMGTPPRPKDPGDAFTTRRQEAIDKKAPDTLYIEFSADEDAQILDWEQVEKANPSFPHRTAKPAILRMQTLIGSDENFKREAYGIWDKIAINKLAFDLAHWQKLKTDPPANGTDSYAVKFSVDGSTIALAAARKPTNGNKPVFVEVIYEAPAAEGLRFVSSWLLERKDKPAQIVVEGKSGAEYLADVLFTGGIRNKHVLWKPTVANAVAAHSMFYNAVREKEIAHSGQDLLEKQIAYATMRKLGNQGGFGWKAPDGETVAALDAATLAFWAAKTSRRKPGRKQRVST